MYSNVDACLLHTVYSATALGGAGIGARGAPLRICAGGSTRASGDGTSATAAPCARSTTVTRGHSSSSDPWPPRPTAAARRLTSHNGGACPLLRPWLLPLSGVVAEWLWDAGVTSSMSSSPKAPAGSSLSAAARACAASPTPPAPVVCAAAATEAAAAAAAAATAACCCCATEPTARTGDPRAPDAAEAPPAVGDGPAPVPVLVAPEPFEENEAPGAPETAAGAATETEAAAGTVASSSGAGASGTGAGRGRSSGREWAATGSTRARCWATLRGSGGSSTDASSVNVNGAIKQKIRRNKRNIRYKHDGGSFRGNLI